MLFQSIQSKWPGWICGGWKNIFMFHNTDNIRSMTTSSTFGVVCMNCSIINRCDCRFDEPRFVEGIGANETLDIQLITNCEAGIDSSRSRAPILVKFKTASTSSYLFAECDWRAIISFASDSDIYWH